MNLILAQVEFNIGPAGGDSRARAYNRGRRGLRPLAPFFLTKQKILLLKWTFPKGEGPQKRQSRRVSEGPSPLGNFIKKLKSFVWPKKTYSIRTNVRLNNRPEGTKRGPIGLDKLIGWMRPKGSSTHYPYARARPQAGERMVQAVAGCISHGVSQFQSNILLPNKYRQPCHQHPNHGHQI